MSQPHDCCLKRKDIAGENCCIFHFAILPSESWTTRIWRLPITWSWGVHYMWGSDMVFPEPSRLKPCLTSWVTPFQTLQLHEKSFRTCGRRELKLVPTCLNMSQPHDCCLKRKDIAGENCCIFHFAILPSESWTTRIWRLPITWSWGVHYMWGSDMVFPEPSRLKPCLTSWVTPFQTLQLHEASIRTCGHRELKLVSTCLNHMTAVLREKTSLVKVMPPCHLGVGPLESEGFPSPEARACITCVGLTWCCLSH